MKLYFSSRMDAQLVSVIIPIYNARKYIKETIESVLDQTYKNIEIIAIEDGSEKPSEDLINDLPRVHYFKQKNKGNAATRNRGIKLSHGELITFLDCDDLFTKDKTERQANYFNKHPECRILSGLTLEFIEKGVTKPVWVRDRALKSAHKGASPGSIMVKREVFDDVGMFDPNFLMTSDTEWLIRAKNKNIKLEYINEIVLYKRIHSENQSAHKTHEIVQKYHSELLSMFKKPQL